MSFSDILLLALRNLRQAKLRAALTITGVVVGVASIVCMVSFALGFQENLLNRTLAKFDIFTTIPVSGASVGFLLEMGQGNLSAEVQDATPAPANPTGHQESRPVEKSRARANEPRRMLDDAALEEIERIPGVLYAFPRVGFTAVAQFEGKTRQMEFLGAPADLGQMPGGKTLLAGKCFSNDYAKEVLVSANFERKLTGARTRPPASPFAVSTEKSDSAEEAKRKTAAEALLGKTLVIFTLRGEPASPGARMDASGRYEVHELKIVGVFSEDQAAGGMFERVFAGGSDLLVPMGQARLFRKLNSDPLSRMGATLLGDTGYPAAVVKVSSPEKTQGVYEQINKLGLRAISLSNQLGEIKRVFFIIDSSLALLGGISLLVAALGISNTLIMSITERTREIGVMKAIGGDERTIMGIFFCEAGLIGFAGGLLGVLIGWAIDGAANALVNHFIAGAGGGGFRVEIFSIPWFLWSGAILFAVAVSLLAAAYPAFRAARVDPIKALRHD